jgi:hypothetical protein
MIAIAAVLGAVVIGGGGAYMVSGSAAVTGGEPPLIKANNEPTKVQPQNPGGVEIPNQNKQIYERAAQSTETKVVNREEQPVDVQQTVRMNGSAVADATGGTVPGGAVKQQQTASLNLGEPRKVRTVTIRPDGTVAGSETAAPQAAAPVPAMTMPAQAQPAPSRWPRPSPSRGQHPRCRSGNPGSGSEARSGGCNAHQRLLAAEGGGGAAYRRGPRSSRGRDDPDRRLLRAAGPRQFRDRSPDGLRLLSAQISRPRRDAVFIRKAEVNGSTVYRVRVGPLSKDEASSLCSKLQGQGGQCFVAKN